MKTIPRSRRKFIAQLATTHTVCSMYDQSSGNMITTAVQYAWRALDTYPHARLTESSDGTKYTVRVHSNLWYELTTPAPVAPAAPPVAEVAAVEDVAPVEGPQDAAARLDVTDWWQVSTKGGAALGRVEGAQYADAKREADLIVPRAVLDRDGGYTLRRMVRGAAGELTLSPDPVPPTVAQRVAMAEEVREAAREGLRLGRITAADAAKLDHAATRIEDAAAKGHG